MQVPGLGHYPVDASWFPDEREGNFLDYNFEIDVYSMTYKTPAQRWRGIMEIVSMVMQMSPILQQQGGSIDMQMLISVASEMLSEPRLEQIIKFMGPSVSQTEMKPQLSLNGPMNMNKPNGNYQRTNVSTRSGPTAGQWAQLQGGQQNQMMMGANQ